MDSSSSDSLSRSVSSESAESLEERFIIGYKFPTQVMESSSGAESDSTTDSQRAHSISTAPPDEVPNIAIASSY